MTATDTAESHLERPGQRPEPLQVRHERSGRLAWGIVGVLVVVIVVIVASGLARDKKSPTAAAGAPSSSVAATSTSAGPSRPSPVSPSSGVVGGTPTPTELGPRFAEIDGVGNATRRVTVPAHRPVILYAVYTGSSSFIVEAKTANGRSLGTPVSAFGTYRGTTIVDAQSGDLTASLKITTDGSWHVELYPITMGYAWDAKSPLKGTSDEVLIVPGGLAVPQPVTVSNVGASNFVVTAYTPGAHLLVNELGVVTSQAVLPAGTQILSVTSDGQWTVTPTATS